MSATHGHPTGRQWGPRAGRRPTAVPDAPAHAVGEREIR